MSDIHAQLLAAQRNAHRRVVCTLCSAELSPSQFAAHAEADHADEQTGLSADERNEWATAHMRSVSVQPYVAGPGPKPFLLFTRCLC